jgi:hypothetical protein
VDDDCAGGIERRLLGIATDLTGAAEAHPGWADDTFAVILAAARVGDADGRRSVSATVGTDEPGDVLALVLHFIRKAYGLQVIAVGTSPAPDLNLPAPPAARAAVAASGAGGVQSRSRAPPPPGPWPRGLSPCPYRRSETRCLHHRLLTRWPPSPAARGR